MNSTLIFKLTCLIVINLLISVCGEFFEACEDQEDGTFVAGNQGCKSYIYCEGEESYEGVCPSQLLFNTEDGSCAPENEVVCSDDEVPIENETEPPPPETTTTTSVAEEIPTTLRPPPQTEGEVVHPDSESTKSPGSLTSIKTNPTSFAPITPTTGSVSVISTPSPPPAQICPASDDPHAVVLLPSETSCSEYFICYHGSPVQMVCSGQLLFDYVTSKCEIPIRAKCKATVQTTPNPKTQCVQNTYDYFPYPKNCNYFYKCMNGFLSLQQCPIGFGWSDEMKLCLKLDHGRCPIRAIDQLQNQLWLNNIV
ncbi:probable endochitinase [Episyrphus balteatus]|uniref:probable endochitinase n=1 Tax=Episyrphus balteatus TaxID=286459 RepID=UPI0024854549|nr:probable endochitinase [Episyrphus balteatus]